MGISYKKLLKRFESEGYNCYTLTKKKKIIGQATWKKLNENGDINTSTIANLCKFLNCQPGDILEYIPDETDENKV